MFWHPKITHFNGKNFMNVGANPHQFINPQPQKHKFAAPEGIIYFINNYKILYKLLSISKGGISCNINYFCSIVKPF